MVKAATATRSLVRVKIADDADLQQALQSLNLASSFFKGVVKRAGECQCAPFAFFQRLSAM